MKGTAVTNEPTNESDDASALLSINVRSALAGLVEPGAEIEQAVENAYRGLLYGLLAGTRYPRQTAQLLEFYELNTNDVPGLWNALENLVDMTLGDTSG
jgi:hypothetical protein